jgi:hypothetical protein
LHIIICALYLLSTTSPVLPLSPYCPPLNVVVLKGNEREREREREERERIGGYIAYKRLPTVPIYRRARKEGP